MYTCAFLVFYHQQNLEIVQDVALQSAFTQAMMLQLGLSAKTRGANGEEASRPMVHMRLWGAPGTTSATSSPMAARGILLDGLQCFTLARCLRLGP